MIDADDKEAELHEIEAIDPTVICQLAEEDFANAAGSGDVAEQ